MRTGELKPAFRNWNPGCRKLICAGLCLHWAALPPLGFWWLGWFVFVPWTLALRLQLSGNDGCRTGFISNWFFGFLFWLATLYFIPIPHPALWGAWPLMCGFLALYFALFWSVTVRICKGWKLPVAVVAPTVWTVMELARCYVFTGFGMALLGHSQYQQPYLIQLSAFGGAYLVTFALALTGAVASSLIDGRERKIALVGLLVTVLLVAAAGFVGINNRPEGGVSSETLEIAIIQGNIDTIFPETSEEQQEYVLKKTEHYRNLTGNALRKGAPGLVVWPEGAFPGIVIVDQDSETMRRERYDEAGEWLYSLWLDIYGRQLRLPEVPPLLTGMSAHRFQDEAFFNAAVLFDKTGKVLGTYRKNHRVICGEYVPFAETFPVFDRWLAETFGVRSIQAGTEAGLVTVGMFNMVPEICFETTVPHLVRRHVNQARLMSVVPDAIVCLTDDGWFFGQSCLDLHLACNVFRAVENRIPVLVAANTGLSAEIDSAGRILQKGPRRDSKILTVQLPRNTRGAPLYSKTGDWLWFGLSGVVLWAWIFAVGKNVENRSIPGQQVLTP